ncbi:MAG: hypothetical protein ACI9MR_002113 [Myxococcota bacterium]|jgi:hypothetical protein
MLAADFGQSTSASITIFDLDGTTEIFSVTRAYYHPAGPSLASLPAGEYLARPTTTYAATYDYTVTLEDRGLEDHGERVDNATELVSFGSEHPGGIGLIGDNDCFAVAVTAGRSYLVEVSSSAGLSKSRWLRGCPPQWPWRIEHCDER